MGDFTGEQWKVYNEHPKWDRSQLKVTTGTDIWLLLEELTGTNQTKYVGFNIGLRFFSRSPECRRGLVVPHPPCTTLITRQWRAVRSMAGRLWRHQSDLHTLYEPSRAAHSQVAWKKAHLHFTFEKCHNGFTFTYKWSPCLIKDVRSEQPGAMVSWLGEKKNKQENKKGHFLREHTASFYTSPI